MRAVHLSIPMLLGCLLPALSYAEPPLSYYEASISSEGHERHGYANLDWSDPDNVHGDLCLMSRDKGAKAIKLPLRGTNRKTGELSLTIPPIAGITFPPQPFVLTRSSDFPLFELASKRVTRWFYYGSLEDESKLFEVDLIRIPSELGSVRYSSGSDDMSYGIMPEDGPTYRYDLSNYDSLTKEEVLALETQRYPYISDGGYERGVVLTVLTPDRLDDLRSFLAEDGGGADFENPSFDACGAPYVQVRISVPPLLEFYYARKLQLTGLVMTAYPYALGAGPSFDSLSISDKKLADLFTASDIDAKEKDQQLWAMIVRNVRAFVQERRPEFQGSGTIARLQRGGGQLFAYRLEIVGPALSECSRNRWEKLLLQVIPQGIIRGEVDLLFQFQDGFFAPGSLDQRPDDARIQENHIPDGRLERLQELLGGFLIAQGFKPSDDGTPSSSDVACKL
jgi:hypothetical protein